MGQSPGRMATGPDGRRRADSRHRVATTILRGIGLRLGALRYLASRSGILATAAADVGAFFRARAGADRPDAENPLRSRESRVSSAWCGVFAGKVGAAS